METYEGHELYRLTDSQMALVLDSMGSSEDKQNRTNAEGIYYLDRNGFSVTAMVRAVNLIVEQNDTLRLRIVKHKGKKRQLFGDYKPFELPVINVRDIDGVRRAIDDCRELVVGLRGERLWEGRIIIAEDGSGAVVLRFNHLCIDGYTLDMILRFIIKYYGALKNGEEPVPEKTGSYRDSIEYESRYLASERCRDDAQWWKNVYKNRFFSRFCIPTGFRTKAERAAIIEKAAGKELSDEVDAYAHITGNSAASLFLAAAALLTQKLTRKNHFQIFTLVHGRSTAVQRRTMGCMVGTAQIEYKIDESVTVDEYLDACCKSYLESMQHSKYFAQRCAGYMIIEDIFHGFNFSTWLIFNNLFYNKAPIPGEYETGYIENDDYCNAQFHADMDHRENGYVMVLQYQARRFSEADAGRLIDRYFDLVKKLMESGPKKLADIGLKQF